MLSFTAGAAEADRLRDVVRSEIAAATIRLFVKMCFISCSFLFDSFVEVFVFPIFGPGDGCLQSYSGVGNLVNLEEVSSSVGGPFFSRCAAFLASFGGCRGLAAELPSGLDELLHRIGTFEYEHDAKVLRAN